MPALRLVLWLMVAVALFVLGALSVGWIGPGQALRAESGSLMQPGAPLGGPFSLIDHEGRPVTEAVLRGKPSAVFFGFTHCPDVCPTALSDMSGWIEALGENADAMRFVFVTVDPERDTPAVLGEYLSAFSDRIIGISGEPEKVHAMVKDHKIYSRKAPLEGGDYSMDHTASVLLLDEAGALVGTIAREESRDTAIAKLGDLVAG